MTPAPRGVSRRTRAVLLSILLLALGGLATFVLSAFFSPNAFEKDEVFYVSKGQTFPTIVDSLEARGLIRSRELFVFVARIVGGMHRLQVGRYTFAARLSNYDLYMSIRTGRDNVLIQVTVPEGLRAEAQARLYARHLGIDTSRFMSLVNDRSFITDLGIRDNALEGYLLPDTYAFSWQQDEAEVIERMVGQFRDFYADSLVDRQEAMGWTARQVLTLASIVEAESRLDAERPVIAGVYLNRLRRGMKLEADPTIQYVLPDGPRRLYYSDLRINSPYNTYRYAGLPPGPINNPGRASVRAVLFPTRHNYVFFVADGQGGHRFAKNYSEHQANVRLYRKVRRAAAARAAASSVLSTPS
jgi:UPF0755 protein